MRTVWWIKRDIRISDNHCLFLATQSSDEVIPFFCWEPSVLNANDYGSFHLQAQWQALKGLFASLHNRGSGIVEGKGEVVAELNTLYKTHPFSALLPGNREQYNLPAGSGGTGMVPGTRGGMGGVGWVKCGQGNVRTAEAQES